ncbi:MAG: sulfatase [Pirellulales bacterium]|nr:sulfatase [Pirellulales bacterium]
MSRLDRREFLTSVAGSVALSAASSAVAADKPETPRRPNIIFYFADQYRADNLGVYGGRNITTPHLDRLAQEGTTFNHATSICPVCTPFRGMLMTGRYPTHSGILMNWIEASARANPNCLANAFGSAGYDTTMIGKWHLSAGRLKHSGKYEPNQDAIKDYQERHPETEFTPPGPDRLGFTNWQSYNFHCEFNNYWYYRDEPKKIHDDAYETDSQTNSAIAYMKKQQAADQPFMMVVAPHPPHPPFSRNTNPAGYLEKIPHKLHFNPNVPKNHPRRRHPLAARCYYAMSKNVDDNIGRLMKFLDDSGLAENTIVVFTSDHGEMHGSHGRINKMVPYTEAVHIPMIVRWPGRIPAGKRTDGLCTPVDFFPTLCGLAGVSVPDTVDGIDLSDVCLGRRQSGREDTLMMNYTSHWDYFQTGTQWPEWRGIHTGNHTYVKWLNGKEELYDNREDPYQMANLAEGSKELPLLKRFRHRIKDLLSEAHDDFPPGTAYADWFDDGRNLLRTSLGPV